MTIMLVVVLLVVTDRDISSVSSFKRGIDDILSILYLYFIRIVIYILSEFNAASIAFCNISKTKAEQRLCVKEKVVQNVNFYNYSTQILFKFYKYSLPRSLKSARELRYRQLGVFHGWMAYSRRQNRNRYR